MLAAWRCYSLGTYNSNKPILVLDTLIFRIRFLFIMAICISQLPTHADSMTAFMLGPYDMVEQTTFSKSKSNKLFANKKQKYRNISIVNYSVTEPFSDLAIRILSELTDQCRFADHHMIFSQLYILQLASYLILSIS